MGQIPLPFSTQLASDDFIVTPCNKEASDMLQNWQHWPYRSAVIQGPEKSGKTVMGNVFTQMSSGIFVDDLDQKDEADVFHMWNSAQQSGQPILLSFSAGCSFDDIELPDLKSRLKASQNIIIAPPDEEMVTALFLKLCYQSGLSVTERMADFVTMRCQRSYDGIMWLVEALNVWALANQKPIGIKVIGELIDQYTHHEDGAA